MTMNALLRCILIFSISMISSKLTHAQIGCRANCAGAESTECIGNFDLGSPCTVCFDEEQGSGFVCLPPIGGDLCGVNGAAVDGICFGASDGSTACTQNIDGDFVCSQPACGTPCSSNNVCKGAVTCNTCVGGFCSVAPSMVPSVAPSGKPSLSVAPSGKPSKKPSRRPSKTKKSKKKLKRTKKPKALKLTKKPKVLKKTKKPKSSTKSEKKK